MNQKNLEKKIILGTAQFANKYGITNKFGTTNNQEIKKILRICKINKVKLIDTAINYKNVEKKLGKYDLNNFQLITKIPSIPINRKNIQNWILSIIKKSLKRLNKKSLYAVLVHNSSDLTGFKKEELYAALQNLKKKKLVKKVGVSIYDFNEMKSIIKQYKIDIVQVPLNILDRRVLNKEILNFLKKKKIEIHARSIFLQGLLLANKKIQYVKFKKWKNIWLNIDSYCKKNKIDVISLALNFVLSQKDIKKIVLGFENSMQLKQVLSNIKFFKKKKFFDDISTKDELLINPNNWKSLND